MIEFRKVTIPDELQAIHRLDQKMFGAFPGDLLPLEVWEGFESYWMVLEGATVGCSAFLHHVDYDKTPRPGCLYIVSTGILPDVRGRGLGRKQKEWQIEYARSHSFEIMVTNMRRSNRPIIHLNEGLGFRFRSTHAAFYDQPEEDAIVMELALTP
jgi:ribosomal protein S18 acetylase RimI-like enzyme